MILATVSNIKNEVPYLKEWVEYHRSVGVDRMYLYNQDTDPEVAEVLQSHTETGFVKLINWAHFENKFDNRKTKFYQSNRNHLAFQDMAAHHRFEADWISKIDADEFLVSTDTSYSVREQFEKVNRSKIRAIRIPRIDFGPNGHEKKPENGLVLPNYLYRDASSTDYKDAANSAFLNSNKWCNSSHRWSYKVGSHLLFPIKKPEEISIGLRLNHYYTKSKEEYFSRQNPSGGRKISQEAYQKTVLRTSQVKDTLILEQKFVP